MKMQFKKEVKHSVVYETADEDAPTKSVYVTKDWLKHNVTLTGNTWPKVIDLEVKVIA